MSKKVLRVAIASAVVMFILSSCSVGFPAKKHDTNVPSASASSSKSGEKIASSLKEYAQSLLDMDAKTPLMGEEQKEIIERAVANDGKLSRADYEQAWNEYRSCIAGRGWTTPPVVQHGDLYGEPEVNTKGMTKEQSDKLFDDIQDCSYKYKTNVDSLYRTQVGNPGLSADSDQLVVDCLIKNGVVPTSFTKKQFEKEMGEDRTPGTKYKGPTSFSIGDERVQSCLFAQGSYLSDDTTSSEPVWKPLG